MPSYKDLNDSLKTKLEANAYIIANSVTVQKWARGMEVQDDDGSISTNDSDLPLAVITIPHAGKTSTDNPRVIDSLIPGMVEIVTVAATRQAGVDPHLDLMDAIETELEALKTSANNLGTNTLVTNVTGVPVSLKRGENWYFITRMTFQIMRTNTF